MPETQDKQKLVRGLREKINGISVMDEPAETYGRPAIPERSEERGDESRQNEILRFERYFLTPAQRRYLVFKRVCDFAISLISLIVLAIPFAVIAIIQKISSLREPIFFSHTRIGRGGKPFKMTKFRSMRSSAPPDCPTKDFLDGERYITKLGRFLRDSSIDELPQLFQVLTGKMSLIGPRPLIPQERNVHIMREQAGVYQLRPGMTGWAQVNGRDLVEDEEKVRLDVEYMQNFGLKMDLKVFGITIKKVLKKADIEEGNINQNK